MGWERGERGVRKGERGVRGAKNLFGANLKLIIMPIDAFQRRTRPGHFLFSTRSWKSGWMRKFSPEVDFDALFENVLFEFPSLEWTSFFVFTQKCCEVTQHRCCVRTITAFASKRSSKKSWPYRKDSNLGLRFLAMKTCPCKQLRSVEIQNGMLGRHYDSTFFYSGWIWTCGPRHARPSSYLFFLLQAR